MFYNDRFVCCCNIFVVVSKGEKKVTSLSKIDFALDKERRKMIDKTIPYVKFQMVEKIWSQVFEVNTRGTFFLNLQLKDTL